MISDRAFFRIVRASLVAYFIAIAAGVIWLTVWLLEKLG